MMTDYLAEGVTAMKDIHQIFARFKEEFPEVYDRHEAIGKEIHEKGGPLAENSRWLIKIAISAACNHKRALATHIKKARAAGVTDAEIKHALLLLIPTAGFPVFMKAYSVLEGSNLKMATDPHRKTQT